MASSETDQQPRNDVSYLCYRNLKHTFEGTPRKDQMTQGFAVSIVNRGDQAKMWMSAKYGGRGWEGCFKTHPSPKWAICFSDVVPSNGAQWLFNVLHPPRCPSQFH